MRLVLSAAIAMTVLGGGVATAAPSPGPTGQEGPQAAVPGYQAAPGTPTTAVTSPDAMGRSATTQVATPAVTRSEMITRAKTWTNVGVPYSQSDYYGGYRTDCSGFVSMAWKLSDSLNTNTLDQVSHRIDKDDLKAGDILLRAGVHVAIFEKWADAAHTEYYVYEQTPPKAVYYKIPYPYYSHDGYLPYRYNNVIEDDGERATYPGLSTISRANGDLDVFGTTSDGHLKHRHMENGVWGCWATLHYNARIKGDPAAIYTAGGRIDVIALGIDNRLKRLTWTTANEGWYQWTDMGADTFTSSPAVTSRWDGGIDVFVKNNANKIVYRHFDMAKGWTTSWSPIGDNAATTTVSSAPAAVASPDGSRMNIFARATDGSLLSLMWTSAGWYSWVDRGGSFTGRPAASTRGGNTVDVFLRGNNDALFHRYSADGGNWSGAADLGGHIYTSPTAVSMSSSRIDVFSRNNEGDLVRKTWTSANDDWYVWAGHGAIGAPAC